MNFSFRQKKLQEFKFREKVFWLYLALPLIHIFKNNLSLPAVTRAVFQYFET